MTNFLKALCSTRLDKELFDFKDDGKRQLPSKSDIDP